MVQRALGSDPGQIITDEHLPEHLQSAGLSATLEAGANLARFIRRCQAKRPVKVVAIGDSILEGATVTSGGGVLGADDALSLVATQTAARFGNTVTRVNHALSGHTVAMGALGLKWNAAVAEQGDLYLIDYLTNDLSAELYATPVPGYDVDAFAAGLERLFRRLRTDVPKADVAFLIAEPYNNPLADTNNSLKRAYADRARDVCAAYGVEVIDGYSAFLNSGGTAPDASLYSDSIHPNKVGHARLATEVMKHLPANHQGPTRLPAAMPAKGLHAPETVAVTQGQDTGTDFLHGPAAVKWVETGTWTDAGSARTTTTPGDKIAGTLTATEIYAMLDTSTSADLHATLKIDGVTVFTNQAFDARPLGNYWTPLVVGLTPASHTFELILVSGTLTVDRLGWLTAAVGGSYNTDIAHVVLGEGSALTQLPTGGTDATLLSTTITLPTGWTTADVYLRGFASYRVTATTTTVRHIRTRLLVAAAEVERHEVTVLPVPENTYAPSARFGGVALGVTNGAAIAVTGSLFSTDKTTTYNNAFKVEAMLVRRT